MKTTINEEDVLGVILKLTPYKESDVIAHVMSKEYGKIGIHARGVRKVTSKNARAMQPLMLSNMTCRIKKGLSSLVRAQPENYYRHIQENLTCEIVAQYICEYYFRYIEENKPNLDDYETLTMSLEALNNGYHPMLVYLLFNVYILKINGVEAHVDDCVKCGKPQVVSISIVEGGFVCEDHIGSLQRYSLDILKGFQFIHMYDIKHIDRIQLEEATLHELNHIIDLFIHDYTGIHLKTKTFLQGIV